MRRILTATADRTDIDQLTSHEIAALCVELVDAGRVDHHGLVEAIREPSPGFADLPGNTPDEPRFKRTCKLPRGDEQPGALEVVTVLPPKESP